MYRRALAVELQHMSFEFEREVSYELFHRGVCVGKYRADLVVERCVVAEVKAGATKDPFAARQLLNYLRAAKLEIGLVIQFGPKLEVRRMVNRG